MLSYLSYRLLLPVEKHKWLTIRRRNLLQCFTNNALLLIAYHRFISPGIFDADIFNLLNEDHLTVVNQNNGFNAYFREFGRQWQLGLRLAF